MRDGEGGEVTYINVKHLALINSLKIYHILLSLGQLGSEKLIEKTRAAGLKERVTQVRFNWIG